MTLITGKIKSGRSKGHQTVVGANGGKFIKSRGLDVDQILEISKNIEMEIVIYDNYTNFQTVQRVQEIGNPFRDRKISKGSEFPELKMENRT